MTPRIIAFTGNASVGKTTVLTRLIADLKEAKINVGYVFDSVRGTLMDMKYADFPEGRKLILFKHLENEMIQILRPDTDVVLLDRSVVDWYIYLLYSLQETHQDAEIHVYEQLMLQEAGKYSSILHFSTEGMDYIKDGFRPKDDDLRSKVQPLYDSILRSMKDQGYPIVTITGNGVPIRYELAKQVISNILGKKL